MVLPNNPNKVILILALAALSTSFFNSIQALAQVGSPLPQSGAPATRYSAPVPGGPNSFGPQAGTGVSGPVSMSDRLPLNAGNAQSRLEVLRNLMPSSRAKEFQESIGEYCDWLQDMADAHWKLSQTFAKDGMKPQADAEKQDCIKFGQLRRQAMLLKAQFLIAQRRFPEALGPLVDIIVAEPKTETGQTAYRLLQDIGFSHYAAPVQAAITADTDNVSGPAVAGSASSSGLPASAAVVAVPVAPVGTGSHTPASPAKLSQSSTQVHGTPVKITAAKNR